MSVSSLRGFPAPAMSFITGPPNLICANPNVLVGGGKKKPNKVLLTIRHRRRVLRRRREVFVRSLSRQMLTWIIRVQRKTPYL